MTQITKQQFWKALQQPGLDQQACMNCKYDNYDVSEDPCHPCCAARDLTDEYIKEGRKDNWEWNGK